MGRKLGWDPMAAPPAPAPIEPGTGDIDDISDAPVDEVTEADEAPAPKPAKKTSKKVSTKKAPEPEPTDEVDPLADFLNDESTDGVALVNDDTPGDEAMSEDASADEPEEVCKGCGESSCDGSCHTSQTPSAKAAKKARKVATKAEPPAPAPEPSTVRAAAVLGLDIRAECPVCRKLDGKCGCEEEDRAFVRRTRFEANVDAVARCPRCRAPMSILYLPRPGLNLGGATTYKLSQFSALYACSCCNGDTLAAVAIKAGR